jgi:hypothetical protein
MSAKSALSKRQRRQRLKDQVKIMLLVDKLNKCGNFNELSRGEQVKLLERDCKRSAQIVVLIMEFNKKYA